MNNIGFIFDLDGTLLDSETVAFITWKNGLADLGFDYTMVDNLETVGQRIGEVFQYMIEKYQLDMNSTELSAYITPYWEALTKDGIPAMAGVHDMLDELKKRNIRWALATSSERAWATDKLEQLGRLHECQAIIGGDDVVNPKPDPTCYLKAAAALNLPIDRCIAVEDSLMGYEAAVASGATVIAIPNRAFSAEQFTQADYIFPSMTDALAQLHVLLQR